MQEGRAALPRSRSDSRQLKQQGKHKRLPGIEGGIAAYPGNHANQRECRTSEVWLCKHSSMSEPEKGWGWWTMRCQQAKQPSPDPALIRQLKQQSTVTVHKAALSKQSCHTRNPHLQARSHTRHHMGLP